MFVVVCLLTVEHRLLLFLMRVIPDVCCLLVAGCCLLHVACCL